ncbi:MAG: protease pro-enzyme activation domain-containing protein [Candidatus Binataceae bacterium]
MAAIKHTVAGSARRPLAGASARGAADSGERMEVTVLVHPKSKDELKTQVNAMIERRLKGRISPEEERRAHNNFRAVHDADPADLDKVEQFARKHGLTAVEKSAARRAVVLSGTVKDFNEAFGVDLEKYEYPGGTYRGRTGPVQIPAELKDVVAGVFGLDDRPQVKPHLRQRGQRGNVQWHANSQPASFSPLDLARLYNFPDGGDGSGQCIGIIEFGGGYRPRDLKTYFQGLGVQTPHVSAVSVDHGHNHPTGDGNGPDGEVMLDIEVAGALAPKAKIAVYFAPNTDRGFIDAVTTAIHDQTNRPSVISISWGGPESEWTQQAMTALDDAFQTAAALGITVCSASGDNGSTDGLDDGASHVDFPASSPYVLACGGTRLVAADGKISDETVWNELPNEGATGGGASAFFSVPGWQDGLKATLASGERVTLRTRGVPDVSGDADPVTGYDVRVDGSDAVIGGTSAVAPLWAGLIACINQLKEHNVGYINPAIYNHPEAFNDVTRGNNGAYSADNKWDACTGMGTPNGKALLAVL